MKNIISITEARSKIFDIAEKVQKPGQIYTFTENGRPKVVMMSAEEYENIMEDMELMSNPKFMARMKKLSSGFVESEHTPWEEVRRELDLKHGNLVVADKSKKKYSLKTKNDKGNK